MYASHNSPKPTHDPVPPTRPMSLGGSTLSSISAPPLLISRPALARQSRIRSGRLPERDPLKIGGQLDRWHCGVVLAFKCARAQKVALRSCTGHRSEARAAPAVCQARRANAVCCGEVEASERAMWRQVQTLRRPHRTAPHRTGGQEVAIPTVPTYLLPLHIGVWRPRPVYCSRSGHSASGVLSQ